MTATFANEITRLLLVTTRPGAAFTARGDVIVVHYFLGRSPSSFAIFVFIAANGLSCSSCPPFPRTILAILICFGQQNIKRSTVEVSQQRLRSEGGASVEKCRAQGLCQEVFDILAPTQPYVLSHIKKFETKKTRVFKDSKNFLYTPHHHRSISQCPNPSAQKWCTCPKPPEKAKNSP